MTNAYQGMHVCKQCNRIELSIVCVYDGIVEVTCDRCGTLSTHPLRPEGIEFDGPQLGTERNDRWHDKKRVTR